MKTVRHLEVYVGNGHGCTLTELRDAMAILEGQLGTDCHIRFRGTDWQTATVEMPDGPRINIGVLLGSAEVEVDRYGSPVSPKNSEKS